MNQDSRAFPFVRLFSAELAAGHRSRVRDR
jgi:hypothetical protein